MIFNDNIMTNQIFL